MQDEPISVGVGARGDLAAAALSRLLEDGTVRAARSGEPHRALWEALIAATEDGKRFRPVLLMAAHDALGGNAGGAAANVGAAVELLHTAFVIHDDVIDGDEVRRGRPNVSGTFRARAVRNGASHRSAGEYGLTAGILAGDLALAAALRAVATCGADNVVVARLLDLFDSALHSTAAGELADVRLSMRSTVSLEESLQMAEQKTSEYSFVLPLQAGAVLAGADDATQEAFADVGRTMGLAFQLLDDLIGVFGDPSVTGKSATSDLRSHKQTPLLVHSRTTTVWPELTKYLGRELDDHELGEARHLLTISGSRRFIEELVEMHLQRARSAVSGLGLSPDVLAAVTVRPGTLVDTECVA